MNSSSKKALVVEDNILHKDLVESILEGMGYTVFTATDGDLGLEIVNREEHLDLIITDIFMPKKEGVGFIRAVKSKHLNVKIIAVTGALNFESISETAMQFGADLIIKKPIDVELFVEQLNHLVEVDG